MQYFRAQSIADIHHGMRKDSFIRKKPYNILSGLRPEKTPDNIFFTLEIRLYLRVFQEYLFFPFQKDLPEIGASQIPAATNNIPFLRPASADDLSGVQFSDRCY